MCIISLSDNQFDVPNQYRVYQSIVGPIFSAPSIFPVSKKSPNLNDQLIETSGIQSFPEDEPGSFGIYQPGYWLVNTRSMKLV